MTNPGEQMPSRPTTGPSQARVSPGRGLKGLLATLALLALSGCGYNNIQTADEGTKQAWSEVVNQYQRRRT